MTKLKDKLSASVRTVKAAQQKTAPVIKPVTKPATRSAAKPAPKPAPKAAVTRTPAGALFPDRVWPD